MVVTSATLRVEEDATVLVRLVHVIVECDRGDASRNVPVRGCEHDLERRATARLESQAQKHVGWVSWLDVRDVLNEAGSVA